MQGERIAAISEVMASPDAIIKPLSIALKRPKLVGQAMTEKDIAEREITLMADKGMPYEVLKKVMGTCTDADYGRISFALLQKDRPVDMAKLRHSL